jgi:Fe-S-cluster containining protein
MSTNCKKCGACCIAPSITTAMPDMPNGKPAGVRCLHLTEENECRIFGRPERPSFCLAWSPTPELCGDSLPEAIRNISALEISTR